MLRSPIQCRQERGHDNCGDRELSVRVNWYFMTTLADTSTGAALYEVRHNPQSDPQNPRHATDTAGSDLELSANLHEVSQCPETASTILEAFALLKPLKIFHNDSLLTTLLMI